jgi:hypothetical protein
MAATYRARRGRPGPRLYNPPPVDRRLAAKNLRTALIAAAIALIVLAASFLAAFVY